MEGFELQNYNLVDTVLSRLRFELPEDIVLLLNKAAFEDNSRGLLRVLIRHGLDRTRCLRLAIVNSKIDHVRLMGETTTNPVLRQAFEDINLSLLARHHRKYAIERYLRGKIKRNLDKLPTTLEVVPAGINVLLFLLFLFFAVLPIAPYVSPT